MLSIERAAARDILEEADISVLEEDVIDFTLDLWEERNDKEDFDNE